MDDIKKSGCIKAINVASVHKICSGQVVLTLATAVKELVENSLDAGATIIEVKLKECGSELIEVVDNGDGVQECDFESLTLKHHTSKLGDFSDLSSVATFGFRGEALSSLCALSNLAIVTCHKDSNIGTRLEYDHNGALVKTSPIPRQTGTTVSVQNLFFTLPVRHKEFHRNLRREFGKMIHLLTAYCLVCTHKRITCINHTEKGRKTIVLSTNGAVTVKDNITCVFGAKQACSLKELVQVTPSESVLAEFYLSKPVDESMNTFRLKGCISSCAHGEGRSSADRQFFFINGRPCDLPKVSKVVNEVYHSFNKHQFPFVFLDISLEKDAVDVNVTPDKRKIFIQHEKLLLATVKSSLLSIYDQQPSVMNSSPLGIVKDRKNFGSVVSHFSPAVQYEENKSPSLSNLKRSLPCNPEDIEHSPSHSFKSPRISESGHCTEEHPLKDVTSISTLTDEGKDIYGSCHDSSATDSAETPLSSQNLSDSESLCIDGNRSSCEKTVLAQQSCHSGTQDNCESLPSLNRSVSEQSWAKSFSPSHVKKGSFLNGINFTLTLPFREDKIEDKVVIKNSKSVKGNQLANIMKFYRTQPEKSVSLQADTMQNGEKCSPARLPSQSINDFFHAKSSVSIQKSENLDHGIEANDRVSSHESEDGTPPQIVSCTPVKSEIAPEEVAVDHPVQRRKRVTHCTFSLDSIKRKLKNKEKAASLNSSQFRKFRSKILPAENESAEDELRREISKDMFSQMEIIGQFNLGFIIARLEDDLFIIDQHATDEKYNYEILQRDTVLETQKLLMPQKLELTAVTEAILLDNIHIFEKNGFKFNIEEDGKPGQRMHLVSVPVSQNWSFGKEDVDELIFMLTDNSGRMCRPSRVNQMFASRACRKSVMIGSHLSVQDMKKLVSHMSEIEQPWNCPHGRPTLRHLFSLKVL